MSKPSDYCKNRCFNRKDGSNLYYRIYQAFGIGTITEDWNGTWNFCPICGKPATKED